MFQKLEQQKSVPFSFLPFLPRVSLQRDWGRDIWKELLVIVGFLLVSLYILFKKKKNLS